MIFYWLFAILRLNNICIYITKLMTVSIEKHLWLKFLVDNINPVKTTKLFMRSRASWICG